MQDPIFLIRDGVTEPATRLIPTQYEKEETFQSLLEKFPELLAGEQIDRDSPRRWLLVAREIGVPDHEEGTTRWELDHLFVDQDGIPTLVEVKRQSDTRLRREVVGQVLEYAANAARWWPSNYLAEQFAKTCAHAMKDATALLSGFLENTGIEPSLFWKKVADRLQAGDMRLIFLADRIPPELLRIVEFLNSQMTKTEVLAVEVQRYSGSGYATHIPRLLGQTSEALRVKEGVRAGTQRRIWDEALFFGELSRQAPEAESAVRAILELGQDAQLQFRYGSGAAQGSINVYKPSVGSRCIVSLLTNGKLQFMLGSLAGAQQEEQARERLGSFAEEALGFQRGPEWKKQYPTFPPNRWVPQVEKIRDLLRTI